MRSCSYCGASLAEDQRYCLECGGRQPQARSQFLERFTPAAAGPAVPAPSTPAGGGRPAGTTVVASIGVLLLAMGVGVLIGRAGSGKTSTSPPQVISVSSPGAPAPATGATTPEAAAPAGGSALPGAGSESSTKGAGTGPSSSSSSSSSSSKTSSGGGAAKTPTKGGGGTSKGGSPTSSAHGGEAAEQRTRNIPNVVTTG